MERRTFLRGSGTLTLASLSGLAGCSVIESVTGPDSGSSSSFEAKVYSKLLLLNFWHSNNPEEPQSRVIFAIGDGWDDPIRSERVQEATDLTADDIEEGIPIEDMPMAEIYAEYDAFQAYSEINLQLQTSDELNDLSPLDDENRALPYFAPVEFFDHLSVDNTYRLRSGRPIGMYGESMEYRIVDILEEIDTDEEE